MPISDPAFSFLVIRHIHHQFQDMKYSFLLGLIIDNPLRNLDQDQLFSFEKNLEWLEFDKILKHYLHNPIPLFQYVFYVTLRLAVHILTW